MELLDKLKSHIRFEEGMDDAMLPSYLAASQSYVQTATGGQDEYSILLVAGIMNEYRAADKEMQSALDAITPFLVQAVFKEVAE